MNPKVFKEMEKNVDRITGLWIEEKNKVNIAIEALELISGKSIWQIPIMRQIAIETLKRLKAK